MLTDREQIYRHVYCAYFTRPFDWSDERAELPDSSFAPVREWLAGMDRVERSTLDRACARLHERGAKQPVVADVRKEYWAVCREIRIEHQQAQPRGTRVSCQRCQDCGVVTVAVARPTPDHGLVVWDGHPYPCEAQRVYRELVPCACETGKGNAARLGFALSYASAERLSRVCILTGEQFLRIAAECEAMLAANAAAGKTDRDARREEDARRGIPGPGEDAEFDRFVDGAEEVAMQAELF